MYRQKAVITDTAASRGVIDAKRAALLFDSIVIVQTREGKLDNVTKHQLFPSVTHKECEWLVDHGIVQLLPDFSEELYNTSDPNDERYTAYRRASAANVLLLNNSDTDYEPMIRSAANFITRYSAARITDKDEDERIIPLLDNSRYELSRMGISIDFPYAAEPKLNYSKSTAMVLAELPTPDDLTPWENIVEFRHDNENALAFFALRDWITQIVRSDISEVDLRDKIEFELARLTSQLERAKIKHRYETVETTVTSSVGILENLIKFKWTEAAKSAFAVRHHHLDMLEAEAKIAENGLYYIVKSREKFK
jgi:hypothetical protein